MGLESSLIGTIENCLFCKLLKNWLGNFSPIVKIKERGLSQVHHLKLYGINEKEKTYVFSSCLPIT